jgi:transcriptional regulator with XRE-family HTH domain
MKNTQEKIKQLRRKKGLTQESMAKLLHIGRSTYCKFELGITKIDYERLKLISNILDVPISEITKEKYTSSEPSSKELSLMLFQTKDQLSQKLYRVTSFDNLTPQHLELLRQKGFDSKEKYEDTPLNGRIYEFGPKDIFKFMIENCGMKVLFERNLILDDYWQNAWKEYIKNKESKTFKTNIELDDQDYFLVYMLLLKFSGGKEKYVQFAERDFLELGDEWNVLEYLKTITGALDGEIICFTTEGYDPVTEIIK